MGRFSGPGRAGQGRTDPKIVKGRAGPRPILSKFDGPGQVAAHEMRALNRLIRSAYRAHAF